MTRRPCTNGRLRLTEALQKDPDLADVNSDQQQSRAGDADLVIDRNTAARLNLTPATIDNTLYDAFGQRQVSTIYNPLNQYHVVMELAPRYWQSPQTLRDVWVSTSGANARRHQHQRVPAGTVQSTRPSTTATASVWRWTRRVTRHPTLWPHPARVARRAVHRSARTRRRWCRWQHSPTSSRATRRSA